jgi:hypothetical protein
MSIEIKKMSRDTYLKALGLFTLAHEHSLKAYEFESALKRLLGAGEEVAGDFGHVSDELYSSDEKVDFDEALRRANYFVAD